jgi:hypothetical protein
MDIAIGYNNITDFLSSSESTSSQVLSLKLACNLSLFFTLPLIQDMFLNLQRFWVKQAAMDIKVVSQVTSII